MVSLFARRRRYKIAIKLSAPSCKKAMNWGDFHVAVALKNEFERRGHQSIVQCYKEWDNEQDKKCHAVIVLRGLKAYQPKEHHINLLWNISHPDRVTINEYNQYHYVFIASNVWAEFIKPTVTVPVEPMLQCTDPRRFKPYQNKKYRHEILFVGNTRGVFRKIIKDLLPTTRELAVYGKNWGNFIHPNYIVGPYVPNEKLNKYYGSCDILLNDHHKDMRKKGFINNRIFDGLASESFIISDNVKGLRDVFGDTVVTYDDRKELAELVEFYLSRPDLRRKKAREGAKLVRREHTYAHRVDRFLQILDYLYPQLF